LFDKGFCLACERVEEGVLELGDFGALCENLLSEEGVCLLRAPPVGGFAGGFVFFEGNASVWQDNDFRNNREGGRD
jgi:hypothetical protein